ncbi:MAG TPA: hypothetical protein VGD08_23825 [Stellaceae bacterium]|jgi:hypothetical protein
MSTRNIRSAMLGLLALIGTVGAAPPLPVTESPDSALPPSPAATDLAKPQESEASGSSTPGPGVRQRRTEQRPDDAEERRRVLMLLLMRSVSSLHPLSGMTGGN